MSIATYGAATSVTSGRPSPIIWADCPVISFLKDPGKGFHIFDDFFEAPGASTVSGSRWYSTTTGGGTRVLTDVETGVLEIRTDATNNDEEVIVTGNNTTGCITPANLSDKKWWFECRMSIGAVLDIGIFVGLFQEGGATADAVMTDTTLAVATSSDMVGFHEADGVALDFVWNLNGQTAQSTNVIAAMAVDTFYNVGMKYTPDDNRVHVYVDGVEDPVSATSFLMSHASAPADTLAVTLALKAITGASSGDSLNIDWVRYAAEY